MANNEWSGDETSGAASVPAYWQPMIADSVENADANAMVDSWTQDTAGLHTVVINVTGTTTKNDPIFWAYHVIPLKDVFDSVIAAGEFSGLRITLSMVSAFVDDDNTAVYAGIVNGATMASDVRLWFRNDALFSAVPGAMRAGIDNTRAAATPTGFGNVDSICDFYSQPAPTVVDIVRLIEVSAVGRDAVGVRIPSSSSSIAGATVDVDAAPHIFIAAGAILATSETTHQFHINVEAYKLPTGAFPSAP